MGDNLFFICVLTRVHQNGTMLNHWVGLKMSIFSVTGEHLGTETGDRAISDKFCGFNLI